MPHTKIVLIGAASVSFGPAMIADALLTPELRGSTLVLVDIDAERLAVMSRVAQRLNEACGAGWRIEQETDRLRALPGAEFVIVSVAVKRDDLWKLDFAIPIQHGVRQVLGENGGPGGLSHALRNIPIVLGIAHDMERVCPKALLLNFTNPESRLCLAISRYSSQPFVGLCHGIGMGFNSVSRLTGVPEDDIDGVAGGLNHLGWFLKLWRKSTGEDLYPALRQADQTYDAEYLPLTRYLFRAFGLYPYPSDDHVGEYISYAADFCGLEGYNFERADAHRAQLWQRLNQVASGSGVAVEEYAGRMHPSGEFALPIIAAQVTGQERRIDAVNIRNDGLIDNLPAWAVVEVPATAGRSGLRGVPVGPLPAGIAGICSAQARVQDLVVDAAVKGSRELALQALLIDPVVPSAQAAERTLDELLAVHAPYLPAFRETGTEQ